MKIYWHLISNYWNGPLYLQHVLHTRYMMRKWCYGEVLDFDFFRSITSLILWFLTLIQMKWTYLHLHQKPFSVFSGRSRAHRCGIFPTLNTRKHRPQNSWTTGTKINVFNESPLIHNFPRFNISMWCILILPFFRIFLGSAMYLGVVWTWFGLQTHCQFCISYYPHWRDI